MSTRRQSPPRPQRPGEDRKTEPGLPRVLEEDEDSGAEETVPSGGREAQVNASALSVIRDDPELARRLGNRSPEEIYGSEDDDESSVSVSHTHRTAHLAMSSTGTAAQPHGARSFGRAKTQPSELLSERSRDATHAGPPVSVEIVAGPDEGATRRFRGVRLLVGRVKGCDLVLSDASVSRKHLELVLGENGVLLRDLASGNGTKVNGERVTERVLSHGDLIALGQTKLRFVDEAEAFRREAEARARGAQAPQKEAAPAAEAPAAAAAPEPPAAPDAGPGQEAPK